MTNPIIRKDNNGNLNYTRLFNANQDGSLKKEVTATRITHPDSAYYDETTFEWEPGSESLGSVNINDSDDNHGNRVFDQSEYYEALGNSISLYSTGFFLREDDDSVSDYFEEQVDAFDNFLGGRKRFDDDPDIDSYWRTSSRHALDGEFVEFLDARDGKLDGTITKETLDEYKEKQKAGIDYTRADFAAAEKIIQKTSVNKLRPDEKDNKPVGGASEQKVKKKTSKKKNSGLVGLLLIAGGAFGIHHFNKKEAEQTAQVSGASYDSSIVASQQVKVS